jgi:hypothetical protein
MAEPDIRRLEEKIDRLQTTLWIILGGLCAVGWALL